MLEIPQDADRLRRLPQQSRSQKRVAQILEAAAQVFAEVGYEAASTTLIATQAKTSVGSLYRFFPDKAAIFQALASYYMDRLRELFAQILNPEIYHLPIRIVSDRIIDAYYDDLLSQPGYRAMLLNYHFSPKATAIIENINREIEPYFEALFAARAPEMEPEQRKLIARVSVEACCVLEFVSSEADDALREKLKAEEKILLSAYLQTYFPDP
ncbi:TetR family transcriptional regulator [Pleurocapsales cyanobacterium LEGE 10410]|nr:TetR family transcriptional regulator [Pleurocapsales cyanobacterium LEGE 10410]